MKGIAGPDTTWSVAVTTPQKDDRASQVIKAFMILLTTAEA
jgi:hypothetical protein